jgi:hypothetical protein
MTGTAIETHRACGLAVTAPRRLRRRHGGHKSTRHFVHPVDESTKGAPMNTARAAPSWAETGDELSRWLVAGGIVTPVLFPFAIPILILTAVFIAPLALIGIVAAVPFGILAGVVLGIRAIARRLGGRRGASTKSTTGSLPQATG